MSSLSIRTVGAALAAVSATATIALAAPADATVRPLTAPDASSVCGWNPPDKDHSPYVRMTNTNVLMFNGPSRSCPRPGQTERGNVLDYHCWVLGSDDKTWTYLRNATRGTMGWIQDDLLPNHGSSVHC